MISGIGVRGAIDPYGFESRLSLVEFVRIVTEKCVRERSRSVGSEMRSSVTVEDYFSGAGAGYQHCLGLCFKCKC